MDREAAAEITSLLGVKPYKVQCADAAPISRPRFCWTNVQFPQLAGVKIVEKATYFEVEALAPYPDRSQWLPDDVDWPGEQEGAVFPTSMKCIRRCQPSPCSGWPRPLSA